MNGILKGLKVLDLTRVLSGPYCTMTLADLGAEVIKIERPGTGDDSREYGPFIHGESAYFMGINRNKKSIAIDLKRKEGKEIILSLIKEVDIIIENYRPGTMEKLGLDYCTLRHWNKQIIYASISGFGQTGPMRRKAAYDGIVQAMGGIMSITGEKGGSALRVGTSIGDIAAGMFCSIGILAALHHRNHTGKGMHIDVAMLDSIIAILENAVSRFLLTGQDPKPNGNTHASIFPFETFKTKDSELMIAAGNDQLWASLCTAIERPELIDDALLKTNPLRNENHDYMFTELSKALGNKTTGKWYQIIDAAGVPCSPVNTISQVLDLPQVKARKLISEVKHPNIGVYKIVNSPIKTTAPTETITTAAPMLGQNTVEILKEYLGYEQEQIEVLLKNKVVE
ncbi:CoA transferase [Anaerovorax odorimutans]|nr:CoA transferase [Anaerovorax odorimutans]